MQQNSKNTILQCRSHPNSIICSVEVSVQCPYKTRFACQECLIDYKSPGNFIELKDFNSTETIINRFQGINGTNDTICSQLKEQQETCQKQIDNLISDLLKQINELKISLIEQLLVTRKEYLMKTEQLKVQYDEQLRKVQNRVSQVEELDNQHIIQEWVELEECIEQYVQLFYQPQNQEVHKILIEIDSLKPIKFDSQSISDFKTYTVSKLDDFQTKLSLYRLTQTIFDKTPFGHQIIDKITDYRSKQMKLIFDGQRDGMNPTAFWKNCTNMGPTITICETKSGGVYGNIQIFGGYTPCKWISNSTYQEDPSLKSFLFSITKQQIYPLRYKDYATYGEKNGGPTFGNGHDLCILKDFRSSGSELGNAYDKAGDTTHVLGTKSKALTSILVYLIE